METLNKGRKLERSAPNDGSNINNIMSRLDSEESEDEREFQRIFRQPPSRKKQHDLFGGTRLAFEGPLIAKKRIKDRAAYAKRSLVPISSYASDRESGVVPGPGTVYFSHLHFGLHKELSPEERVLDMTGSLAPAPVAVVPQVPDFATFPSLNPVTLLPPIYPATTHALTSLSLSDSHLPPSSRSIISFHTSISVIWASLNQISLTVTGLVTTSSLKREFADPVTVSDIIFCLSAQPVAKSGCDSGQCECSNFAGCGFEMGGFLRLHNGVKDTGYHRSSFWYRPQALPRCGNKTNLLGPRRTLPALPVTADVFRVSIQEKDKDLNRADGAYAFSTATHDWSHIDCNIASASHPKPTCSQLMGSDDELEDMDIGIKNEVPDSSQSLVLPLLSTETMATASGLQPAPATATVTASSIRRSIRVNYAQRMLSAAYPQVAESISSIMDGNVQPESISGWKAAEAVLEGEKPLDLPDALSLQVQPEEEETKDVVSHECVCQIASIEGLEPRSKVGVGIAGGRGRRFTWIYWATLTMFRVVEYLAIKAFQFLVLACAIVLLFDMLMELRQVEQYYRD
ncbi:hypothetical protein BKA70DRAFT_1238702 [Coprinopsis sp. MPI-PUGE-AT-0042]|nr:hypothetical protein BKA70DRAFT_1238702 [Coprinopsis sp. MPI-PUGE-AT-0042]